MFAGVSGGGVYIRVRPSGRAPIVASIVGALIIVLGLGLFNIAAQLAMH